MKKILLLVNFCLLLYFPIAAQQLGIFEFTGVSTMDGEFNEVTAQPASATFSAFTRSNVNWTSASNVFNSNGWCANCATPDASEYIQFSITADPGYTLTLDRLDFFQQGSNTVANQYRVAYSTDGFATTASFMDDNVTNPGTNESWDFTNFTTNVGATVTFRVYVFGTTSVNGGTPAGTGTFRVDAVALFGTVQAMGGVCSIGLPSTSTPTCNGNNAQSTISFTVAEGSGDYRVINTATNAVLGSVSGAALDGNVMIPITVTGPTTAQVLNIAVEDVNTGSCSSTAININIPQCPPQLTCPEVAITSASCNTLIDFTGFMGSGFSPSPSASQLCSNNWEITGFDDGTLLFGGTRTTGDFARGNAVYVPASNNTITGTDPNDPTPAAVASGGIYALHYGSGDIALWVQPSGGNFDPGSITLRVVNNTGSSIEDLCLSYDFLALNNDSRDNSFDLKYSLMYSMNGTNYNSLINSATTEAAMGSGLQIFNRIACISNVNLADGETIYLRWESQSVGAGSRDEFGIDNIAICPATPFEIDAVAACTGAEKNQYFIEVNNISGGSGPYTVSIAGQPDQIFNGSKLTFGPFDHSGIGGALKSVFVTDQNNLVGSKNVAEVVCGYPQNQAFCDCSDDPNSPTDDNYVNAGAILAQSAPGSFEIEDATQAYILVQNATIVAVNKKGLFHNLPEGSYSVYAINYRTDDPNEVATIQSYLEVGDPIQPILDGVNGTGDLAGFCYVICGSADYEVGCGIVANDQTYTIPTCASSVEVCYSFNLVSCFEDEPVFDADLWSVDFGSLVPTTPTPTVQYVGGALNISYCFSIESEDALANVGLGAGVYPLTIKFNGNTVVTRLKIIATQATTDYEDLSCTGTVNLKLDDGCTATVKASQVLKGAVVCDEEFCVYVVHVVNGRSFINKNGEVTEGCGQYIYRVYGKDGNGNCDENNLICWGYLNAEDKTAPQIECPEDAYEGARVSPVYTIEGTLENGDDEFDPTTQTCFFSTSVAGFGPTIELLGTYRYYDLHEFRVDRDGIYTFHLLTNFDYSGLAAIFVGAKVTGNPNNTSPLFDPYHPCEDIIAFADYSFAPGPWSGLGDYLNFLGNINGWSIYLSGLYNGQGSSEPTIRTFLKAGQTYTLLTTSTKGYDTGDYRWLIFPDNPAAKVDDAVSNAFSSSSLSTPDVVLFDENATLTNPLICTDKDYLVLPSVKCYWTEADGTLITSGPKAINGSLKAVLERTGYPHKDDAFGGWVADNCGDIQICVSDVTADYGDCREWVVTRRFTATDECGNLKDYCEQYISVRQPTLEDVVLPHYTAYIECDETYVTIPGTDRPSPAVTGYPFVVTAFGFYDLGVPGAQTYCKLGATYTDKSRIDICDESFKFIREWTVVDWCNPGRTIIYNQLIKVGDFTPPTVGDLPRDPWDCAPTFSTGPFTCESNFLIPTPDGLSDNCSDEITISVDIIAFVAEKDDHGFYTGEYTETIFRQALKPGQAVYNVPKGLHLFKYVVSDGCHNKTTRYYWFQVLDRSEPVAQCDDFLNVSVSGQTIQGSTRIYAEDVDEGSYDDCGPIALKTRRAFKDLTCADQYVQQFYNTTLDNLFLVEKFDLYQYGRDNGTPELYRYYHNPVDVYMNEIGTPIFTYEGGILYSLLNDYVDILCCDVKDSVRIELWVFDDANMNGIPGDYDFIFGSDVKGNFNDTLEVNEYYESYSWLLAEFCEVNNGRTDYEKPCVPEDCGQVWDNHNVCWLDVLIEDKAKPLCKPPFAQNIPCTDNRVRYEDAFTCADSTLLNEFFGKFEGVDNCGVHVECVEVIDTRDNCGTGTIRRRYRAIDDWGNQSAICEQVISVYGVHEYMIGFPADKSGECGEVLDTCIYVQEIACDLLAVAVKDTKFEASGDECYKIERTFKVINWCEYDGISDPYVISRDVDGDGVPGDEDIWVIRRPSRVFLDRAGSSSRNWVQDLCASSVTLPSETDGTPGANTEGNATPRTDQFPDAPWNRLNPRGAWDWADFIVDYVNGLPKIRLAGTNDDASATDDKLYAPGQTGLVYGDLTNYATGYWQYTQFIKVYDDIDPTVQAEEQVFCSYSSDIAKGCPAPADIVFTVDENCTPNDITVKVFLDAFANGTIDASSLLPGNTLKANFGASVTGTYPNFTISGGSYPLGDHIFEVHVLDGCGNSTVARIPFSIIDCKAPSPICIHGLAVELMPVQPAADVDGDGDTDNGAMTICAKDFIASPITDCSGPITYSINRIGETPDSSQKCIVVTCDDPATLEIEIYAWDSANNPTAVQPDSTVGGPNYDKCVTYVLVQDNMFNVCNQVGSGTIAGIINTEDAEPVENVNVQLSGQVSQHKLTNVQGRYAFNNLQTDYDYTVTPTLDANPLNGVSTFDIILITKHILGVEALNSPYKMIAADINNSKTITTLDLIQLRKLILSVDIEFANNTSWRFVDASFVFPNPANPWATEFPEVRNINDLPGTLTNVDFVAIKTGDINGNARTSSINGTEIRDLRGTFAFEVENEQLKAGNEYVVDFKASDIIDIQGYQATLTFDANTLELVDILEDQIKAENFGLRFVEEGIITTSWNGAVTDEDATLFSLVFRTKADAQLSDLLGVNSRYTVAEAYSKNDELQDVAIQFSNGVTVVAGFELFQNVPNPFKNRTVIRFQLPTAADATLTIADVTGKVLKVVRGAYVKGMNQIEIDSQELPTGVLTYTLQSGEFTATKKMIVLD